MFFGCCCLFCRCFLRSNLLCSYFLCAVFLHGCFSGCLLCCFRLLRSYCKLLWFLSRHAGKYSYTKCRDLKGNGILSFIAFCLLAGLCTQINDSLSAIFFAVTVEDFFIFSIERNSHLIIFIWNCRKVADCQKCFIRVFRLTKECQDIFFIFHKLDPFKSFIIIIHLIHCRL